MDQASTSKKLRGLGLAAGVAVSGLLATAGVASAAAPTGDYADFKYCPYQNSAVVSCVKSDNYDGSFKFGNSTIPLAPKVLTLQGGLKQDPNTNATTFVNANGAPTLSSAALNVPGGLFGIMGSGAPSGTPNDVTATPELVGPVGYDAGALLTQNGPAVTLPLRIKLSNPFLGSNCYIGSASNPVTLRLTTGTTSPPPPNTPISGSRGTITVSNNGNVLRSMAYKLVDNAFSVPAATDCGSTLFDKPFVTAAVNGKTGLPSTAGKNSATLIGNLKQADADAVRASVR